MEPAVVVRRKRSISETTDLNLCIVCQNNVKGQILRSTADGVVRLKQAANERWQLQDYDSIDVIDRIRAYNEPNEESESTAFRAWHISRLKR